VLVQYKRMTEGTNGPEYRPDNDKSHGKKLRRNAFSTRLDNLKAPCALHFAYYNFCRIHQTLRVRPAMEEGLANHPWKI
jgi:hypothetical protein